MKNLHKKIGAMVLAGMVVFGGVAAGGVNSFAASNRIAASSRINFFINKFNGEIVNASNDKKELKKYIQENHIGRNSIYKGGNIGVPANIALPLQNAKNRNKEYVEIQFQDNNYLIKLNK